MRSSRDSMRRDGAPYPPRRPDTRFDERSGGRIDNRSDARSDMRANSRVDSRVDARGSRFDGRTDPRRSYARSSAPYGSMPNAASDANRKRFRSSPGPYSGELSAQLAGAVGSRSASYSDAELASAPRLSELRQARRSDPAWPWDRHAAGYENVSAQALKLLGYAAPDSTYTPSSVPEEIVKIRSTKPLRPESSWIVCQVGSTVYDSPRAAATALANTPASGSGAERPADARRVVQAKLGDEPLGECDKDLFTDVNAVIVKSGASAEEIEEKYGSKIGKSESIAGPATVVKFETLPLALQDGDMWLFPDRELDPPAIELLNAFSLARPDASDVLPAISKMCTELGYAPARVWRSSDNLPYIVPRVFIELQAPDMARKAAASLGEMTLDGRPLISTLTYSNRQGQTTE